MSAFFYIACMFAAVIIGCLAGAIAMSFIVARVKWFKEKEFPYTVRCKTCEKIVELKEVGTIIKNEKVEYNAEHVNPGIGVLDLIMKDDVIKCDCGKKPYLEQSFSHYGKHKRYAYICDCGETGFESDTVNGAIEYWNRRKEIRK